MPDVQLTVGGTAYGGWKTVRIVRGIEQLSGTFELGVSELWPGQDVSRQILPGDRCELSVDGETIITGHVDDLVPAHDAGAHTVTVTGRDAVGDLIDCSAIFKSGKWKDLKAEAIAADLCEPFGIEVSALVDTGAALASWNIQEGESAFECLARLARHCGFLLISDGKGGLLITRAGTIQVPTALARGSNILAASGRLSYRDRFSEYIVKGDAPGTDERHAKDAVTKASVKDGAIERYRPLVVIADDNVSTAEAQRRAEWERSVRAGRSVSISVSYQGWSHAGGLWHPNRLVTVKDEWLRVDHELLISTVDFSIDDEAGTLTRLQLTLPQAFSTTPLPEKKKKTTSLEDIVPWIPAE